jgi:polyhydroxyalkanoate synthesis regulator phasin
MLLDDLRETFEALLGTLTPTNAQKLAKDLTAPGAAKEQVTKVAADLMEWSQHNRERVRDFVGKEVQRQMTLVGVATHSEVDALKRRVRDLEREAGMTPSGRKKTTSRKKTTTRKKPTARKKSTARTTPQASSSAPASPDATPPEGS